MKDIKFLFLYPPEQTWPGFMCKPNGSLAYPYLVGALREIGVESYIYDACCGNEEDDLDKFFYESKELASGMLQTGVSDDRILEIASRYDAVGITSIFSQQETQVLRCARLIKENFPEIILFSGGVNARARKDLFFDAGFDVVCTSESEETIKEIAQLLKTNSKDFSKVVKIYYKGTTGEIIDNTSLGQVLLDLDQLPIPAWDMLPNERYWKIGRPHGGNIKPGTELKYASIMTSRGCPFHCSYCHIADEVEGSIAGGIGKFRIKSDDRVLEELLILRDKIGAKQIYIEDDSILGIKHRAIKLLKRITGLGLDLMDVNGVNMIHLVKKSNKRGWMVPDEELIELLVEVGFTDINLPFESGNSRIIKRWCSNKLALDRFDPGELIKSLKKHDVNITTNYMLGFPDETKEEIENTIKFGKSMMDFGIDVSNFFLVMPLPGTPIFDYCIQNGHLPTDFNPDRFQWTKANLDNIAIGKKELEELRDKAWEECNGEEFKNLRKSWVVKN